VASDEGQERITVSEVTVEIRHPQVLTATRYVIRMVRRHPRDWARLRRRVRSFRYLITEDDKTLGEWRYDPEAVRRLWEAQQANPRLCLKTPVDVTFHVPGWIEISRRAVRLPYDRLVAPYCS
jgi:hypothetical protein